MLNAFNWNPAGQKYKTFTATAQFSLVLSIGECCGRKPLPAHLHSDKNRLGPSGDAFNCTNILFPINIPNEGGGLSPRK